MYENLCWCFFDDILVYSRGKEEHKRHVEQVLRCLLKNALVVNGGKCEFGIRRVAYLGPVISEEGVAVDKEKVNAMLVWPTPKNISSCVDFLDSLGIIGVS